MTGFFAAARRDGTLRRTAVAAVAIALLFRFAFGEPWPTTVAVVAAGCGATLATDYADHRGTPTAVRHLAFGTGLVLVAIGWWALSGVGSTPPPLAVVAAVAGSWLLLDGWTARRTDHPDARTPPGGDTADELSDLGDGGFASDFRGFQRLGAVGRAIDNGATTPEAIADQLDRPVASVQRDLDRLGAAGVVEPVGDEPLAPAENRPDSDGATAPQRYRLTDREWSVAAAATSWPRRLLARLLRPLRLLVPDGG